MMSRWLLALVLAAAGVPCVAARGAATTRDALAVIDACIHQLDPRLDIGAARIAERCPDLAPVVASGPWAAWLPADWDKPGNELSAAGLAELRTLLTRQPPVPGVRAPRVARVGAALAALNLDEQARRGWWARFKQWLREVFTPRPQSRDAGWLRRIFGDEPLSQAALEAIGWSAMALVVAVAAAIIVNELRVAGLLGRRRPRSAQGRGDQDDVQALTLREVEEASPAQQPRLLLELIVARLHAQQRLPPARALTVHELARAARLPREVDRERLEVLAATCEQIRFADCEVPAAMLALAIVRGREVLGALERPALQPQGAA
jgi:hypothetical protein